MFLGCSPRVKIVELFDLLLLVYRLRKLTISLFVAFEWLKELNQTAPCFMTQELHRNQCIHGRPKKYFQVTTSKFCLCFSGCWRCIANARSQNTLPFLPHKSVLVEPQISFFVWNVFYTSVIRYAFSFHKLPNIHFWVLSTNKLSFKNSQRPENMSTEAQPESGPRGHARPKQTC